MAALTLSAIEKAIMDAVETYVQDANLSGVESPVGAQIIRPLPEYGSAIMTKNNNEFQVITKAPFKAVVAAFLKALRASAPVVVSNFSGNWGPGDDATYDTSVSYAATADGEVVIRGVAKAPAAPGLDSAIFNLPAGFKPARTVAFPVLTKGTFIAAVILVQANGDVIYRGTPTGNALVHLGCIRFRAA